MHVLIIDDEFQDSSAPGEALRGLVDALVELEISTITATTYEDGWQRFLSDPDIGCIVADWDLTEERADGEHLVKLLIDGIRRRNHAIPILLATDRLGVEGIPTDILQSIDGYIWTCEDSPDFMAGRIQQAVVGYENQLLPPFFKALA